MNVIRRSRSDESQTRPEQPADPDAAPTAVLPTAPPADAAASVPAGADPDRSRRPGFVTRGRLRRRLRYLRQVRELGLRDVGGLVFDQHRFGQAKPELIHNKLAALSAVDAELRALERTLGERRAVTELREPGISACPRCGALHGSDARFCPSCGVPLRGPRAMAGIGESVSEAVGEIGPLSLPSVPPPTAPATAAPASSAAEPQPTQAMEAIPNDTTTAPANGPAPPRAPASAERREP